ncbi:hypothetical protein CHS0354_033713 [Potamilus streckersoni]|uniref:DNA helicase n=1 Tax=Potamilus streckersoni TaxID=2493646 RepID=A0AAE0S204_9BIVA|nr:hypothetical protein CHS0354_033713 [Potamilus streckersoni]
MSKGSNLNTLLNYRFVKKPVAKLEAHGSDSQSSTGSSGSNITQLLSQDSTQPPIPFDENELTPDTQGSVMSNSSATVNAVMETPSSNLTSPGSPVFPGKCKKALNVINSTDDSQPSTSSSPWLAKSTGHLVNGTVKDNVKKKQKMKDQNDTLSSDEGSENGDSAISVVYDDQLTNLRQMFPAKDDQDLKDALRKTNGPSQGNSNLAKFKRIKQHSSDSSDSEDPLQKPRKRFRPMLSSDNSNGVPDEMNNIDSQATESYSQNSSARNTFKDSQATEAYSLSSQNVENKDEDKQVDESSTKESKITFLADAFPHHSRRILSKALEENKWEVADASIALANIAAKPDKKEIDLSDEDEEYGSGDEDYDSEDSLEECDGMQSERDVILSFFEESTQEELATMPGCSKKKAELIISLRPFKSWETLVNKFTTTKGLTYEVISGCRELIKIRVVVIRLMQKCEKISEQMEMQVAHLREKSSIDISDDDQITRQPAILNKEQHLKPFQIVGLNWLKIMHSQELNGILADEMGLGKTVQAIAFLAHLLEEGEEGPHVIIVPSSTIDNWLREMRTWCTSMKVVVYYGSQEDRRSTRQYIMYNDSDFNVLLTTYNMATGSVEDRSLFKKFEFHYAIFDEGHMLKNMSSLRFQNLMRINAQRRLLLTGTPLQNNLVELMSLLCFVMPDMFIGKTEHLKRIFTAITRSGGDDSKRSKYESERIAHAKRIMRPFVLRRLKSEVMSQMPKKTEIVERCWMSPSQQELYDSLVQKYKKRLQENEAEIVSGGAALLMQLRKAANHPLLHRSHFTDRKIKTLSKLLAEESSHKDRGALPHLIAEDMSVLSDFEINSICKHYKAALGEFQLDDSLIGESGKFSMLEGMLQTMKEQGDRVLLFSQFTSMLDIVEVFMKQQNHKYLRLDGQTAVPERLKLIDQYNTDHSIFVFLLSTKAGGLGINLTSANVVILHDIDFNPYNDKQAEDRSHRVGQTREVRIIRLISRDTVEEAMLQCANEKLKLEKDLILSDIDGEKENPGDVAFVLRKALETTYKS